MQYVIECNAWRQPMWWNYSNPYAQNWNAYCMNKTISVQLKACRPTLLWRNDWPSHCNIVTYPLTGSVEGYIFNWCGLLGLDCMHSTNVKAMLVFMLVRWTIWVFGLFVLKPRTAQTSNDVGVHVGAMNNLSFRFVCIKATDSTNVKRCWCSCWCDEQSEFSVCLY